MTFRTVPLDDNFIREFFYQSKCKLISKRQFVISEVIRIFNVMFFWVVTLFVGFFFTGLIPPLFPTHCVYCEARINSGIPIDNEQRSSLSPGGKLKLTGNFHRI
jgi:hypothetical protein